MPASWLQKDKQLCWGEIKACRIPVSHKDCRMHPGCFLIPQNMLFPTRICTPLMRQESAGLRKQDSWCEMNIPAHPVAFDHNRSARRKDPGLNGYSLPDTVSFGAKSRTIAGFSVKNRTSPFICFLFFPFLLFCRIRFFFLKTARRRIFFRDVCSISIKFQGSGVL